MSKKTDKNDNTAYEKSGYKPASDGSVTGGHKPEKSERKPVNPPKKK